MFVGLCINYLTFFFNEMYFILVAIQNIFTFLEQDHISSLHSSTFSMISVASRLKRSIIFIISEIVYALELLSQFSQQPWKGRAPVSPVLLLRIRNSEQGSRVHRSKWQSQSLIGKVRPGWGANRGGGASPALPQISVPTPIIKYGQLLFRCPPRRFWGGGAS